MSAEGALGYWMMERRFASRSLAFPLDPALLRTASPPGWAGPLLLRTAMHPCTWDKVRPAPFATTLHRHPQGGILMPLQPVILDVFIDISIRLPTQSQEFL